MAESSLFDELAALEKEVADALDELVDVVLIQRSQAEDPVTGLRPPVEVPLKVRREGIAGVSIDPDRTDPRSRWLITIYDRVLVTEDDAIRWAGKEHQITRVRGLARNSGDDERYVSRVETN